MQTSELVTIAKELRWLFEEKGLIQRYQDLQDALRNVAQNPARVAEVHESLLQIQKRFEDSGLSPAQRDFIRRMGGSNLLGTAGIDEIEKAFNDNRANPTGVARALSQMQQELTTLQTRANHLVQALADFQSDADGREPLEPGEGRLWLRFEEAADVTSISDLRKAADTWQKVLHHFSRMPGASGDEGRIEYIQKTSPLELQVVAEIAKLIPLAYGVKFLLARIDEVVKILQQWEVLKQMKIGTQALEMLGREATERRRKAVDDAADAIQTQFGTTPEARNAARAGLAKILKFVQKGGVLDVDVPASAEDAESEEVQDGSDKLLTFRTKDEIRQLVLGLREETKKLRAYGADPKKLLADHADEEIGEATTDEGGDTDELEADE
jgi:hypothetical protein